MAHFCAVQERNSRGEKVLENRYFSAIHLVPYVIQRLVEKKTGFPPQKYVLLPLAGALLAILMMCKSQPFSFANRNF